MLFSLALTRLARLFCVKAKALRRSRLSAAVRNLTAPSGKPDNAASTTDETLSAACFRKSGPVTILNA